MKIAGYDTALVLYCDISGKAMLKEIQKEFPLIQGISTGNILVCPNQILIKNNIINLAKSILARAKSNHIFKY